MHLALRVAGFEAGVRNVSGSGMRPRVRIGSASTSSNWPRPSGVVVVVCSVMLSSAADDLDFLQIVPQEAA